MENISFFMAVLSAENGKISINILMSIDPFFKQKSKIYFLNISVVKMNNISNK